MFRSLTIRTSGVTKRQGLERSSLSKPFYGCSEALPHFANRFNDCGEARRWEEKLSKKKIEQSITEKEARRGDAETKVCSNLRSTAERQCFKQRLWRMLVNGGTVNRENGEEEDDRVSLWCWCAWPDLPGQLLEYRRMAYG